jgi:5S rRNA maturation endonuclease (ribonuclease M5)
MNSQQAKSIPLADVMARLGYEPLKTFKGGQEVQYRSPFRHEKEPSFYVNIVKNVWYDFGEKGGNTLDFAMRHENCDVKGALEFLARLFSKGYRPIRAAQDAVLPTGDPTLELTEVKPLNSRSLIKYLTEVRAIDVSVARTHLEEIHFRNKTEGKHYFAAGIKNRSGGYEVRNPYFKSSIGKKDFSLIEGKEGRGEAMVFEGFMDFLSCLTDTGKKQMECDVFVLNSVSFRQPVVDFIKDKGYQKVYTFFDNDKGGMEATEFFKQELGGIVEAYNHFYQPHKDYNQFLTERKKELGQGRG